MPASKENLLTHPIEQYLYSLVSHSGFQPEQLPGELQLCEKFNVARGTVRRAFSNQIRRGIVIQLTGRRGYFSNPCFSRKGHYMIGVLIGNGYTPTLSYATSEIMTGFSQKIKPLYFDYNFLSLPDNTPDQMISVIENSGIDALLWVAPPDTCLASPIPDFLRKRQCPAVFIDDVFRPAEILPGRNFLAYNQKNGGILRAEQLLRDRCRRPVYCSELKKAPAAFMEFMNRLDVPFGPERILSGIDSLPDQLRELLNRHEIDSVVSDGGSERYKAVLTALASHPDGPNIRIYLEKGASAEYHRSCFPQLDITYFDLLDMLATQRRAGQRAAVLMRRMIQKKNCTFTTEFFH